MSIKIKLLLWLLAVPLGAALAGAIALWYREAEFFRALQSAARMNGLPAPKVRR